MPDDRASVGPAGELMEVAEQQSAILTMRELRRQGLSLRAIAAAVARQHRIEISHAGVAKVLASPRGRRAIPLQAELV